MISKEILKQLKQSNIGKDPDKTKERMSEIWKVSGLTKRDEMMEYSGLKKFTFERSYKEGNISAKLAVTVAEVMQINPFYLTGESNDKNDYSEEKIREFLIACNYGDLIERTAKSTKKAADKKVKAVGRKTDDNDKVKTEPKEISADKKTNNKVKVADTNTDDNDKVKIEPKEIAADKKANNNDKASSKKTDDNDKVKPEPDEIAADRSTDKPMTKTEIKVEETPEIKQSTDSADISFDTLLARIKDKAQAVTIEKKDLLCQIPEEKVQTLISTLRLRAQYDEEAELLNVLLNLIITSM